MSRTSCHSPFVFLVFLVFCCLCVFFFFFQAEDGIRDVAVTGVQTCALPISLREAIGIEVDDYLVKPVQPRQILSVITRLLEGDRIRQQRLARDFVTRFRELEGRRGATLAWREWIELVAELARWEVRLGAANEPGLSEALRSLQRSLRKDFAEYVARQYPRWLASPEGDRPPLSVDVGAEFLVPVLRSTGRVLFVVIDCLRLDQWEVLRDLVTPLFDVEESHYYSILPT